MTNSGDAKGIQMKLTKLQNLAEGTSAAAGAAKVFKIMDPLEEKMDKTYDYVVHVMKTLNSDVLADFLKNEGFPATESKAARDAAKAAFDAVKKLANEVSDLHQALGTHFEDDDLKEAKEQSAQMNTKKPLKLKDFEIKDIVYHAVSSKKEGTVLRLVKGKGNAWGVPGVGRDAVIVDTGNGIKVFHPSELKLDGGK